MPTILHISDLHRTSRPRLSNDELLAAISSDAARWNGEGIPNPDLIVVSGDLIQGSSIGISDTDAEIAAQYDEAGDFLKRLSADFVDSDRSRVVIVPGNHDVHWRRARNSMEPLETCPDRIPIKALEPNSMVRWNWQDQKAYSIKNHDLYESRFQHFKQFRSDFYATLDTNPLACDDGDLIFCEYPSLNLVVVGFASWHGNDCFCHVGEIDSASLASSRELLAASNAQVAIAVWHHSVSGGPRTQDYMDQRIIHKLIDFGFSIGLHGHQHYPGAAPFELRLPNLTSMAVVGAGSLAVGDKELPMGERRQFNIVDIDLEKESITIHVRAMSAGGVFTGSHRDDFGGNTFVKLGLPRSPSRPKAATPTHILDEAMTAVTTEHYEKALNLLDSIECSHSHAKRQVKIMALDGLGRQRELTELLNPPQTADEVVRLISLLLEEKRIDEATAQLDAASALIDHAMYRCLTVTIEKERSI